MKQLLFVFALAMPAFSQWSAPAEVRHQEDLCLTYRAMIDGPYLVVEANIQPGWHTFSMDNQKRAEEKLAGRKAISMDKSTEIAATGLQVSGPWMQTAPKDFSKPELRWFSFGYEGKALFVAKAKRAGSAPAELKITGQACTESVCKNIDVAVAVPAGKPGSGASVNLKELVPVK